MQALAYRSNVAAAETGFVEAGFEFFGVLWRVRTDDPLALELLNRLYGSYASPPIPTAEQFTLTRLAGTPGHWRLISDGSETFFDSIQPAVQELEYQVCRRAIDAASGFVILHGATILGPAGGTFIAGHSEAGKTTLALALAARGHAVLSDDVAFLDPRSGALRPLPRCFHLDERSRRLLRRAGLRLPERARRTGFVVPADVTASRATEIPIRHIICLNSKRGATPSLTAATQATAAARLSQEAGWGNLSGPEAILALGRMAGAARCWTLQSGRLQPTAAAVAALIEEI